jgi:hypothetical protein
MNGTPASTSRRAVRHDWPSLDLPYLSLTESGSFARLKISLLSPHIKSMFTALRESMMSLSMGCLSNSFSKAILLSILSFSIFYPLVELGQSNGMLFLQENLLETLDVDKTALMIGAVIAISRIVRVFSDMIFLRIYKRLKSKVGILLPLLLTLAFMLLLLGSFFKSKNPSTG